MNPNTYLMPEWPAPTHVKAVCTTRIGGVSQAPYDSFNLGDHVGDDIKQVRLNRIQLQNDWHLNKPIQFLKQVHGTRVVNFPHDQELTADAAYTLATQQVCAVMTADCLPLLVSNQAGTEIAAIHAGWRGLLAGVIEQTLDLFQSSPSELLVWLGPALKQCHFEVNEEIYQAYLKKNPLYQTAFQLHAGYFGDLAELARINLRHRGIHAIYGGDLCSYCESSRFYSHRRDQGKTGRFASLIWID